MNCILKLTKGYLISFILFFVLTMFISVLMKFTALSENMSIYYLIGALCLSTMFLGFFAGQLMKKNGLLWGFIFSVIFVFLIILVINCAYFKELSPECFNTLYLIPVIMGSIGGIIGVNVKK